MSIKHLAKGSLLPPLKPDTLRLYSMLYCPFAQRTRLVLIHKNIPHETVNVNLRYKASWLWERNPQGLVPILEENEKVIYESTVCNEYLDAAYPGPPLISPTPYGRAQQKQLMKLYDKVVALFHAQNTKDDKRRDRARAQMLKKLHYFEDYIVDKYFGGKEPDIVDYHMYPWFERFPAMKQLNNFDALPADRFPKLTSWLQEMYKTEPVQKTRLTTEEHIQFMLHYALGEPIYDFDTVSAKL